jgi:FixJ family two-component response regulator
MVNLLSRSGKETVCILDDKPPVLDRIAEILSSAGFRIRPLRHAATLLEYARTDRPGVAFIVVAGSGADGLKIAAQLRELVDLIYQRCTGITQRMGRMEKAAG